MRQPTLPTFAATRLLPLLLLLLLLVVPVLGLSSASLASSANNYTSASCRCFPGDACWPNSATWQKFNASVGGRLVATVPLAAPCHGASYNELACAAVQAAWYYPEIHINSSSSIMAPFFANHSCDPFLPPSAPCEVGALVQYAVDARAGVPDIQATIAFARQHNLRLVIRNTAHDWLGKSTGAGALAIWTHNYQQDVEVLDYESSFYSGKALKFVAGTQEQTAQQAAHDNGLVIAGPTVGSVGHAGGYTQGGGHGLLASALGLSADNTLEWEVVTPDGVLRTASPTTNPDLYWALSGGGGGTFGVVVSLTVRAHPDAVTAAANLTWSTQGISYDTFWTATETYMASLPPLLDAGVGGLFTVSDTTFSLSPAVAFGLSQAELDALYQPILESLEKLNISYVYYSAGFPTYLDMYTTIIQESNAVTDMFQIGSRLVPRTVIQNSLANLTSALQDVVGYGGGVSALTFNLSMVPPPLNNSVNPAFRESVISLVLAAYYNYTDWAADVATENLITDTIVPRVASVIPGGGSAYLNEADAFEPEWQRVFYGASYPGLLQVKDTYDPDRLLYARTAVGSEAWEEQPDGRLCRA